MSSQDVAKRVILEEAAALLRLASDVPADFNVIVNYIVNFKGRLILSGIGKSGYIAHKIAASMASTGTKAFYVHPAEASHGDLGMINDGDIVMMLSNSGDTKELVDIINYCKRFAIKIIAITMNTDSLLARNCDFILPIPKSNEASSVLAPTTSALMMLALGDALAVAIQEARGFTKDDFKIYHPGGKIGVQLLRISDLMCQGEKIPVVYTNTSFQDTILTMTAKSLGCAIVLNKDERVVGIVTDGDLRRHIKDIALGKTAEEIMTVNPHTLPSNKLAAEALYLMNDRKITVLPVVDETKLVGVLHIHDMLKIGIR